MQQQICNLLPVGAADTVIFDTDISGDCDDAGALAALAHGLARTRARLGAVINDTDNPYGCGTIDAILSYYGINAPIGMTADKGFWGGITEGSLHKYTKPVAERFSKAFCGGTLNIENALSLYRRTLENAADGSVVLITVGFLNTAAEILEKEPALFTRKVRCVVAMAGNFAEPEKPEWNVQKQIPAAKYFLENCPVPIAFLGFEVGEAFRTGFTAPQPENPVYMAYDLYCGGIRYSWDPAAVDFAFLGCGADWQLSEPFSLTVAEDGAFHILPGVNGNRFCLSFAASDAISHIKTRLERQFATKP